MDADVIVIGAGLAGLVACLEAVDASRRVLLIDQESERNLGGQAYWSLGGLFLVNSPEQRRLGVRDNRELAWQDWLGSSAFDRPEDHWPKRWAEAYVDFASGEKRAWLHALGLKFFPVVGWAERGGYLASGHGNSVPRFHLTWGTGPGVLEPFVARVYQAAESGMLRFAFRHRVNELLVTNGKISGARGDVLKPCSLERGQKSSREVVDQFEARAGAVVVASGGIGANMDLVRKHWPERMGKPPESMVCGVPDYVDGRMLEISQRAGANLINRDRMWHYTEGVKNWAPIWSEHGIRIVPGPSSLWFDARGKRLPAPLFPGFDTLGTLHHIRESGFDYSWFVLNQRIIEKEFALSGSEQNPDLTGKSLWKTLSRILPGTPPPVEAFKKKGADFVVASQLSDLVAGMNKLTPEPLLDLATVHSEIVARDRQIEHAFGKDLQVQALRATRSYLGDRLVRTAAPHRILDPKAGPLIAVKLHILTRKTLGGLETDLQSRVLGPDGEPCPGLFAAGEAAGFGGGGMHGYRALEGTFLGGCLFSGRAAGRSAASHT